MDQKNLNMDALLAHAWEALESAYAPYSSFCVGAAVITTDGDIFSGCNVENASYGGTICAERSAIAAAVNRGALHPGTLDAVLIATPTTEPIAPCGLCRQVIEEFAHKNTVIILSTKPGQVAKTFKHRELLPFSFNRKHLQA
jgi:cytidine deaminase